jgi:hypothetical protein
MAGAQSSAVYGGCRRHRLNEDYRLAVGRL